MSPKKNSKLSLVSVLTIVLAGATTTSAQAQGVQNWINNEANKIQQDYSGGAINGTQAAGLQNKVQQIQNQEAIDKSQNGGYLTPQQSQQIGQELQRNNQRTNNAMYNNNPYASGAYQQAPYNNGAYQQAPYNNGRRGLYTNGNYAPANPGQGQNWRNGQMQGNAYVPGTNGQYAGNNGQYGNNGHHHHQHRYEAQNQ